MYVKKLQLGQRIIYKSQSALILLLHLLREKSRSRRLFACNRTHEGSGRCQLFLRGRLRRLSSLVTKY